MDKGYNQAIENIAYAIDQASIQTLEPIVLEHGEVPIDVVNVLLSEEDHEHWDKIEHVAEVVCKTYGVTYDTMMSDVSACLMMNLMAHELGVQ